MAFNYRRHNARTELQIALDGDFAKIGKKHYRHVSGAEIKYNWNRWLWETPWHLCATLEHAVYEVRRGS